MNVDRRAMFFLVAAVACFLLVFVAQDEYKEVAAGTGTVYVLLSLLSALDHWSRDRIARKASDRFGRDLPR